MSESTATKSKVFKEDLQFATGGTGADEEANRITSTGGEVTLTKIDASHINFRTLAKSLDDLVDGGKDVTIQPNNIDAGGTLEVAGAVTFPTLTPAGFVINSTGGLLSSAAIAATDLPTAIDAIKIANGTISNTEFQYLNGVSSNIQDQIDALTNATGQSFAVLQNRQIQNTDGGTATSGSWLIVPLNTEYEDDDSIVDVSALPAFSLAAGTYRIEADIPFVRTDVSQARLYNVTDAAVQQNVGALDMLGTSGYAYATSLVNHHSKIYGTFTITDTKQFRIEYQVQTTKADTGHGEAANFGVEVYAQVRITKIA